MDKSRIKKKDQTSSLLLLLLSLLLMPVAPQLPLSCLLRWFACSFLDESPWNVAAKLQNSVGVKDNSWGEFLQLFDIVLLEKVKILNNALYQNTSVWRTIFVLLEIRWLRIYILKRLFCFEITSDLFFNNKY